MMSVALNGHQHDVLSIIPADNEYTIRYGSKNRTVAFSSSNSTVVIRSSVLLRYPLFHHPCCTLISVYGCDQLSMLRICLKSFPVALGHQPLLVQVPGPLQLIQSSSNASYANDLIPYTSHLSKLTRSMQLFIKSIRNTTISIHIDPTSSIYDLKHLIHAHDGIPPCDQRLLHRGRELRDDALLSGLDVDGATITCLLRVLGGNLYDRIPIHWWFGFSRSWQDGRAGEEGRTRHVLGEFEFEGVCPLNWDSDVPLSKCNGVWFYTSIVLIVIR